MEVSPLTQQERPATFQPKIAQLYDDLFQQDDDGLSESDGFWREFWLLKPDKSRLQQRLESLSPRDILHLQSESQQLFVQAVYQVREAKAPMDENALDTLAVYLSVVLTKRYTNPSADIITVIAGLDEVDTVFLNFAIAIEECILNGRSIGIRDKAVDVALALSSGAYQTSLVTYFAQRDLFPAIAKYVADVESIHAHSRAFLLLGILSSYNKFDFRNPYRVRFEDFSDENTIQKMVSAFGNAMTGSRDRYLAIEDDIAAGWTLSNTLAYIGLGVLAPLRPVKQAPQITADEPRKEFGNLPDTSVAVLLGAYEFTCANKVFCHSSITCPATSRGAETPLSAFISFCSYMLHHAHRSARATTYGLLVLLQMRLLIEDVILCKILCDSENLQTVRLCRQRPPFLPSSHPLRTPMAHILDVLVDSINHNLRRHLDLQLYISILGLMHRVLSYCAFSRTRLVYHWSLLWQTLLSFLRFLTTYASGFASDDPELPRLLKPFISTVALAVISGESFLPDPASYDDLFYKLVEASDTLTRFKNAFHAHLRPTDDRSPSTIDVLIEVASHYQGLVQAERGTGRLGNNPSARQISKIIRQGYETLSLPPMEGLDRWDRFREGEEKGVLKRVARLAVEDAKRMVKPT